MDALARASGARPPFASTYIRSQPASGPAAPSLPTTDPVIQAGLRYFLVPAAQSAAEIAAARAVAGDGVEVIPVATVDDAIAALGRIGGDPPVTHPG